MRIEKYFVLEPHDEAYRKLKKALYYAPPEEHHQITKVRNLLSSSEDLRLHEDQLENLVQQLGMHAEQALRTANDVHEDAITRDRKAVDEVVRAHITHYHNVRAAEEVLTKLWTLN